MANEFKNLFGVSTVSYNYGRVTIVDSPNERSTGETLGRDTTLNVKYLKKDNGDEFIVFQHTSGASIKANGEIDPRRTRTKTVKVPISGELKKIEYVGSIGDNNITFKDIPRDVDIEIFDPNGKDSFNISYSDGATPETIKEESEAGNRFRLSGTVKLNLRKPLTEKEGTEEIAKVKAANVNGKISDESTNMYIADIGKNLESSRILERLGRLDTGAKTDQVSIDATEQTIEVARNSNAKFQIQFSGARIFQGTWQNNGKTYGIELTPSTRGEHVAEDVLGYPIYRLDPSKQYKVDSEYDSTNGTRSYRQIISEG